MKYSFALGAAAAFAQQAAGHYIWTSVDLDGDVGASGDGIRPVGNGNSPVIGKSI